MVFMATRNGGGGGEPGKGSERGRDRSCEGDEAFQGGFHRVRTSASCRQNQGFGTSVGDVAEHENMGAIGDNR